MPFSAEEFLDLIRLLEERPEWRADLRRLLLTDELLALPGLVRELTEAQRRSQEELARLRTETEQRFREVAEAQLALTHGVNDLRESIGVLGEQVRGLMADIGSLKQDGLERRYRERSYAYFSRLVRRAHTLSGDELAALLEPAIARGELSEEAAEEVTWADAIVRGRWRQDGQEVYLVVEVSWGVGLHDVERALRRAQLLSQVGVKGIPVVAGEWVTPDGQAAARLSHVWQVTNGRSVPPEQT
jgi:hypothetical protein